ncbi:IPT/TIG domain-containing protein [Candidatus Uabimicrobium sp. HlEnr_7]|uniref:IPT/TIG domain-containing protein n=1 Tax=Candidatus Uabimicrobium helgolandensis TaxID=3095367 RepID=UPI0035575A43
MESCNQKMLFIVLFLSFLVSIFAESPRQLKEDAITTLSNISTTDPVVQKVIDTTRISIQKSLTFKAQSLFIDGFRISAKDGPKVFSNSKRAVTTLVKSIAKDSTPQEIKDTFQQIVDSLVLSDKQIADLSLQTAQAMIGVFEVNANLFGRAVEKFTSGEQETNVAKAIAFFGQSWRFSQKAVFSKLKNIAITDFNDSPNPFDPTNEQSILDATVRIEKLAPKQFLDFTQVIKDSSNNIVRTIVTKNQVVSRSVDVQVRSIWDGRNDGGNLVALGNYSYIAYAQLFTLRNGLPTIKELSFPISGNITVVESGPNIVSINPTQGSSSGGTVVTINGDNFENGATIFFGANQASNVLVNSNQITCTTPPETLKRGTVNVSVTNPDNKSDTLNDAFTYFSDVTIFVCPGLGGNMLTFNQKDTGNVAPIRELDGGLNDADGIFFSNGEIFIGDGAEIFVFNEDDEGIAAPKRTISGNNTGLENAGGLYVANGEIFIADQEDEVIFVFNEDDNGNVTPKRTIIGGNTTLKNPVNLVVSEGEIFVANTTIGSIVVFNEDDNGNVAPKRILQGSNTQFTLPNGIFVTENEMFVVEDSGSIHVFDKDNEGNVTPKRSIIGSKTTLSKPFGIFVVGGEVFVIDIGSNAIVIFNENDNGNITPKRIISGENTNLNVHVDIALKVTKEKLLWTDRTNKIFERDLISGETIELINSGLNFPSDVDLDLSAGKMYWANRLDQKIQRSDLNGSNIEDLVIGTEVSGLALDVANGKMYWTAILLNKIQRSNLDGSNQEDLVTISESSAPEYIALDLTENKMYWSDDGQKDIKRANLDGSNVETVISGLPFPLGIAIDSVGKKIYWSDESTDNIQRANLDGSNIEQIVTAGNPQDITLDLKNGKLYWGDSGSGGLNKIQRANLDGSGVEDFITNVQPRGLVLTTSPNINISQLKNNMAINVNRTSFGVVIKWKDSNNSDTIGFNVWREEKNGYIQINKMLILSNKTNPKENYSYIDYSHQGLNYKIERVTFLEKSYKSQPIPVKK